MERKLQKRTVQLLNVEWESVPQFVFPEIEWQCILEGTPVIPSLPPLVPETPPLGVPTGSGIFSSEPFVPFAGDAALTDISKDISGTAFTLFITLVLYVQHSFVTAAMQSSSELGRARAELVDDWHALISAVFPDSMIELSIEAELSMDTYLGYLVRAAPMGLDHGEVREVCLALSRRAAARGRVLFGSESGSSDGASPMSWDPPRSLAELSNLLDNPAPGALPALVPDVIVGQPAVMIRVLQSSICGLVGHAAIDERLVVPLS
eukprot:c12229_g1_i1.p1 GENE.c12229_g1_i1~~c12229_g1_i1.p1  ORF type:complete len:264 (+),score=32.23 c12229_g1_i1:111-902(+)